MIFQNDQGMQKKSFYEHYEVNTRMDAFSDGVFAIVVTLLVLELRVPELRNPTVSELWQGLLKLKSSFVSFALSFFYVASVWYTHVYLFKVLNRVDSVIIWLNNLSLFFICFIPFPTALIGQYTHNSLAAAIFGIVVFLLLATNCLIIWYSMFKNDFLDTNLDKATIRANAKVVFWLLPFSIVPIVLSFVNPLISVIIYFCMVTSSIVLAVRTKMAGLSEERYEDAGGEEAGGSS